MSSETTRELPSTMHNVIEWWNLEEEEISKRFQAYMDYNKENDTDMTYEQVYFSQPIYHFLLLSQNEKITDFLGGREVQAD